MKNIIVITALLIIVHASTTVHAQDKQVPLEGCVKRISMPYYLINGKLYTDTIKIKEYLGPIRGSVIRFKHIISKDKAQSKFGIAAPNGILKGRMGHKRYIEFDNFMSRIN